MLVPVQRHVADPARGRLRILDALTLCAIAAVVLLVSLPRLREFALRENESDARALVSRLGEMLAASPAPPRDVELLLAEHSEFARQLDDAEFLDGGRILRRHGYLFELERDGTALAVCAWPWIHRQTGVPAFRWTVERGLSVHDNQAGRWSGPQNPPPPSVADSGWRVLAAR